MTSTSSRAVAASSSARSRSATAWPGTKPKSSSPSGSARPPVRGSSGTKTAPDREPCGRRPRGRRVRWRTDDRCASPHTGSLYPGTHDGRTATARLRTSQPLEGHHLISRSTIAAAARVIEYAAARPIVLSADLLPPSRGVEGVEAADAKDSRANGLVSPPPHP